MKTLIKKYSIILFLSCFFFGCTEKENIGPELRTGTIVLNLPSLQLKTLVPDISMVVESYDIYGTGPGGSVFSTTSNQPIAEISGLDFGEWIVTADAKNVDETIIGHGVETCAVHAGETTVVNITVTPLDGTGTVDLNVIWNANDTEYPSIESQLLPAIGSLIDLDFAVTGGNQGNCLNSTIQTGFHTLTVKLLDGNPADITPILTMGAVEVVRIVKDETTYGAFDFTKINQPGGSIQVNIDQQLNDPIDVTLNGQQDSIAVDGSMTVTASVPLEVGNVTNVWYINGESVGTGSSYTVTGLPSGVYRLDIVVFSTNGERAGSMSCEFIVMEIETTLPPLVFEDFNDGDISDWYNPGSANILVTSPVYEGLYAFIIERVGSESDFSKLLPNPISIQSLSLHVLVSDISQGELIIHIDDANGNQAILATIQSGNLYVFDGNTGTSVMVSTISEINQWYKIEFSNINFAAKTFDIMLDGVQIATDFQFRGWPNMPDFFQRLSLTNANIGRSAYIDLIEYEIE